MAYNIRTSEDKWVWIRATVNELSNNVEEFYYLLVPRRLNQAEREQVPRVPATHIRLAIKQARGGESPLVIMGQGKFGTVYKAYLRNNARCTSTEVVVKESRKGGRSRRMLQEAQFLQYLQDTNSVPKLYGMVSRKDFKGLCIVQSLFAKGVTLQDVLNDFDKLPKNQRRLLAWNLVRGLHAIHKKGVQMNDIHTRNILVDVDCPNKSIRYIDMGSASVGPVVKRSRQRGIVHPLVNPRRYAPEVLDEGLLTQEAEVYTLGFLLECLNKDVDDAVVAKACEICMAKDPSERDLARAVSLLFAGVFDRRMESLTVYVQKMIVSVGKLVGNVEETLQV